MVTKRFTGRAYALLWYGTVSTIIVAAVVMSLARVLLPLADDYRGRVEQWVSAQLGEPVRIREMNVRLLGASPTLIFSGVELRESSDSGARFDELHFGFDPVASLRRMQPVLNKVVIRGASLSIERLPSGQFRVHGLALKGGDAAPTRDSAALGGLLSSQPAVIIRDSSIIWQDHRRGGESFTFKGLEVELNNTGERHRLDAEFRLPEKLGGAVRLAVDLEGDLFRPDLGRGTLHVRAQRWRPGPWLRALPGTGPNIAGGEADVSLWARWEAQRITSVSGLATGTQVQIPGAEGAGQIDRIAARGSWRRNDDGWRLEVAGLDIERGDSRWRNGRIQAFGSTDGEVLRLKANRVVLADAAVLAGLWPAMAREHRDMLAQASPAGVVTDLRLSREHGRLTLQARAEDLGMSPVGKLPGFSGVDGTLLFEGDRGELQLTSRDTDVRMPSLFRKPLSVEHLDGRVRFSRTEGRWRFSAPKLTLGNRDVNAEIALVVDTVDKGSPYIDLRGRFEGVPAKRVAHYLPVGVMPPKSVQWLSNAFRAGRVPKGSLLFHGRAADFPFRKGEGQFLVRFDAKDVDLDYKPHWPVARGLDGHIEFDGKGLRVRARGGRILKSAVQQVDVRVADLSRPLLQLEGSVHGSVSDLLGFLRHSGLVKGDALAGFSAAGNSTLSVKLRQPISPQVRSAAYVRGTVKLLDASLQVARGVSLEQLNGTVKFDGTRITSRRIDGRFLGQPLQLTIYNRGRGKTLSTQVALRGTVDGKQLSQLTDSPLLTGIRGQTPWQGVLILPHHAMASDAEFRFSSQLEGLGTSLPAPLNKERAARESLMAVFRPGKRQGELVWERRLGLNFEYTEQGSLRRAAVDFSGQQTPKLPDQEILRITGSMDGLSPSEWGALAGSGGAVAELPPIHVDMDRVRIVSGETEAAANYASSSQRLPDMDVRVNTLRYDDMLLGNVQFRGTRGPRAFLLRDMKVKAPHLQVEGTGKWDFTDTPGKSEVQLAFSSDDLGAAMRDLRIASVIREGEGTAKLSLDWPGGPGDFTLAKLNGSLRVDVKDGRMEEFDPGAGRLLGLLSLQALHRRLLLDFSDLFGKGMPFDAIKGNIRVVDGDAHTDNLRLESLPASVYVTGRTGLKGRNYDHLITVVPQVSGTLPVAGGLWLGPQVGAALLIFQQLLGDRIDEGAQFQYRVTGGWDEPKVEPVEALAAEIPASAVEIE